MVCKHLSDVREHGLNVWFEPAKPRIHIVLVHGLSSHPYWAWHFAAVPPPDTSAAAAVRSFADSALSLLSISSTRPTAWENLSEPTPADTLNHFGIFWPRDLLPLSVSDARVSTIGYRSQWDASKFETSFKECGDQLLAALQQDRRNGNGTRLPILFIAHSFGGLVVQSALVTARISQEHQGLSGSTAGAIFLGCPFGGTDCAAVVDRWTTLFGNRQAILQSLKSGSPQLFSLQDDFRKAYPELPVVCFYEKLKSAASTVLVVKQEAAKIPGAPSFAMHRDHRSLNKFASIKDEAYLQVLNAIQNMRKGVLHRKSSYPSAGPRIFDISSKDMIPRSFAEPARPGISDSMRPLYSHHEDAGRYSHAPPMLFGRRTPQSKLPEPASGPERARAWLETQRRHETWPTIVNQSKALEPLPLSPPAPAHARRARRGRYDSRQPAAARSRKATSVATEDYSTVNPTSPVTLRPRHNLSTYLVQSYDILDSELQSQALREEPPPHASTASATKRSHVPRQIVGLHDGNLPAQTMVDLDWQEAVLDDVELATPGRNPSNPLHANLGLRAMPTQLPASCTQPGRSFGPIRFNCDAAPIDEAGPNGRKSHEARLENVIPMTASFALSTRTALAGPPGIGKSRIARTLIERLSANTSVLWLRASSSKELLRDCDLVLRHLGHPVPVPEVSGWDRLAETQDRLSIMSEHWLVVLDGVDDIDDNAGFEKYCTAFLPSHGSVMMTGRRLDLARMFASEAGRTVVVGGLDPCEVAYLLSVDTLRPESPVFDELAQQLEYLPRAIVEARSFLARSRMPPGHYSDYIGRICDAQLWAPGSDEVEAAKLLCAINKGLCLPSQRDGHTLQSCAVLRSCVAASSQLDFDLFDSQYAEAGSLLSTLSVIGHGSFSRVALTRLASATAVQTLLDHCMLTSRAEEQLLALSSLLMTSRRVWLLAIDKLSGAHKVALKALATCYPDVNVEADWLLFQDLEPFAERILQGTTSAWLRADDTSVRYRVMLYHKRSMYYHTMHDTNMAETLQTSAKTAYEDLWTARQAQSYSPNTGDL